MSAWRINPWIADLPAYEPGRPMADLARELGLDGPEDIIKLASNENALGPSPRAVEALCAAAGQVHHYPDGGACLLRDALARHLNTSSDQILFGNGSNELIELLGHTFLAAGTHTVVSQYGFALYRLVSLLFQAEVTAAPMQGFEHDLDAMREAIRPETRLVFIANPNNPTGTGVSADALDRFVASMPEQVVTVIDEAYVELLPPEEQPDSLRYVREGRRVCLLRTFSKGYGLAGLRIGYLVAPADLVALINRTRQPFNVNQLAQVAARAALEDQAHLEKTRRMVRAGLDQITGLLEKAGVEYVPSCANFLLVRVGDGRAIFQALQQAHVIVRPMDGYGLPEYVRITVGTEAENAKCLTALLAELARRKGTP